MNQMRGTQIEVSDALLLMSAMSLLSFIDWWIWVAIKVEGEL
jgi:hypothetical protein